MEMGGIEKLVSMLEGATDDRTRKAALKALDVLSHTGKMSWEVKYTMKSVTNNFSFQWFMPMMISM